MWKWFKWVLLGIGTLIVAGAILVYKNMQMSFSPIDGDKPPQFIQADFVELEKIYTISRFRSGVGHDYSHGSDETCRSMKHYFSSWDPNQQDYKQQGLDMEAWPHPVEGKDVTIFSPVDGRIVQIEQGKEMWARDEIVIVSNSQKSIRIRLMHVTPLNGIKEGPVKAGQKVGLVLANQSFDIAIEQVTPLKTVYISYFAVMPDNVFAKYQARGVQSRDELIISRAYRDAHPFQCEGEKSEQFVKNDALAQSESENNVYLSGYVPPDNQKELQEKQKKQ